jgi:3',5'-cyclic AMP phosphodiesterase CpdA
MKFAFITDYHLEATPADFHSQTYYDGGHAAIARGLHSFMVRNHVDVLLLGGDMTHTTSDAEIARFFHLFKEIRAPIYMCLGNHDLARSAETDHLALWKAALAPYRNFHLAPAFAALDGVDLIAFNPQWSDAHGNGHFFWSAETPCSARISPADLAWLESVMAKNPGRPAMLVAHEGLDPVPPALSGLPEDIHVPAAEYARPLTTLLDRYPRVRLVLSGHNHVTLATRCNGRVHTTTGSTSEYPCAARLIETTPREIRVTTHPLVEWPARIARVPGPRAAWATGRETDRTIVTASCP